MEQTALPRLTDLEQDEYGASIDEITDGYVYVKLSNLFPESLLSCDIYMLAMRPQTTSGCF